MKKLTALLFASVFSIFSLNSKAESITLGWAAWDPANALQELSKEFTAETGIDDW
jgi:multiple sugar transport system substrate-binding protein